MYSQRIKTAARDQFIDITAQVQALVDEAQVGEGIAVVYCPHTTAALTINENADPDVVRDMLALLDRMVPWRGDYRHGEGNTAAHMKASMLGSTVTVPIADGRLALGTWQGIYFCEFDGPRSRQWFAQILPSSKKV